MRRLLLALVFLVLAASPASAALQFSGTNQCAYTASTLAAVATTKVSISAWVYWDSFADDDQVLVELGSNFGTPTNGAFIVLPNSSSGSSAFEILSSLVGPSYNGGRIARPTGAAWHHYVFTLDRTTGTGLGVTAYVDGADVGETQTQSSDMTGSYDNAVLHLMARACDGTPALDADGRVAELAIWTGLVLNATDASNLYNSGNGALATSVQSGNLSYYWKLCTDGTATTGGINLTLVGTPTTATHPISTCDGAARRGRVTQE